VARRFAAPRFSARFAAPLALRRLEGSLVCGAFVRGALEGGVDGAVADGASDDGAGAFVAGGLGRDCGSLGAGWEPGAASGRGAAVFGAGSGSGACARDVDDHASARTNAPKRSHPVRGARDIRSLLAAIRAA
jgi:hypothetical protein